MIKKNPERICVSILGPLGDVINSTPVFRQLHKSYPNAHIDIITIPQGAASTTGIPEITGKYIYKREKGLIGLINMYKFAQTVQKPDIYILLDNSFRSALLSYLIHSPIRIGRKGQLKEFLLTHTIDYLKEEANEQIPVYEHYYRCLKPLGIYNSNNKTSFYIFFLEKF